MEAVRVHPGSALRLEQVPDPEPGSNEVLIELRAAALNRRDLLVRSGLYGFPLPLIPGSDGAGIRRDTGEEVIILPSLHWGPDEAAPGIAFEILGGPRDGTYAELIAIPAENVYPKPSWLSWEQAAALPLAGLTAFRALFVRGKLAPGETVLILGAGSGVSTLAVQLANLTGARVFVTSSDSAKVERAIDVGAMGGVLYTRPDWVEHVRDLANGGFDLVLDSVGSTWQDSLRAAREGGRVVVFGATGGGSTALDVRSFYFRQVSLLGTTMGSAADFEAFLRMAQASGLTPVVDSVWSLAEAEAAQQRLSRSVHFGKILLRAPS